MYKTKRKTGFVGFIFAIKSVKMLFKDLVGSIDPPMNYLLTYKFSQDHLELFYSTARLSAEYTDLNYWIKHPFEFSDPILKPEYL